MTKQPTIQSADIDKYDDFDLHELEAELQLIQQQVPPDATSKQAARIVRQALRKRQRYIKAKVMEFEQINDHHLLIFDSTDNFSKIAGHSILFYTLTIADRIHRRYSVKNDTDDYSRSEDGIVSIRSLDQLSIQLAEINIFPDYKLSTTELHYYKLPRTYSDEQIAKLRDRSRHDIERITSIILPKSPIPALYNLLLELNRLLYHNCKHISDGLARETIIRQILFDANEALVSYLNYANARPSAGIVRRQLQNSVFPTVSSATNKPQSIQAQNLFNILLNIRNIRNSMANIENLHLLHHRELCTILEKLVEIERLTAKEYTKQLRQDQDRDVRQ